MQESITKIYFCIYLFFLLVKISDLAIRKHFCFTTLSKETIFVGICLVVENAAQADSSPVSKEVTPVCFPESRTCELIPYRILSQI